MSQKTIKISTRILTIILALLFVLSASMKLFQSPSVTAQATAMGMNSLTFRLLGVVEILGVVLFLLPRTGVVGSLLLIAYMGGAIATHLQHGQPVGMAVAIEALLWITVVLRFPEFTHRLLPSRHKHLGKE